MLRFKNIIQILFYVCLLGLMACAAEHKEGRKTELNFDQSAQIAEILQKPEEIVFSQVQELVFNQSCVQCHSSNKEKKSNVALDNYDSLFGKNSKLVVVPFNPQVSLVYETLIVSAGNRHMPPVDHPQLSEAQKNLVYQWINSGAKDEATQIVERPKSIKEILEPYFLKPETIDYKIVKIHVLERNCTECHSRSGIKADIDGAIRYGQDLTDYPSLFTNSGIVKEKLTDYVEQIDGKLKKKKGSRIYKSLALHQTMPPSKDGYSPMESERIKLLRLWIENCAIEDYQQLGEDNLLPEDDPLRINGKVRACN